VWRDSLPRLGWLAIPVSILVGDFFFRWGERLPPNLTHSPSNLLASVALSFILWWSLSRLVGLTKRRRLWAAAIAAPTAALTAATWHFCATTGHDPGPSAVLYLWQEPGSAAHMMGSRLSLVLVLGIAALAGLWTAALSAWRGELTPVIKRSSQLAPALFLFGAVFWPAGMTVGQTPFTADFQAVQTLAHGARQIASGGGKATLGVGHRPKLEPAEEVDGPNVIVFLTESLRRDRLELYGHDRATTPQITQFIADHPGQVHRFDRAVSTSASTHLSVPSVLSGAYMARSHEVTHRMPMLWHYASAVGAQSFLVSPQDWTWQNMHDFLLLHSPPDHVLTARDFDAPIVNDVGIDDRLVTEALAELLDREVASERPFAGVVQTNATHFPFLSASVDWEVDDVGALYDASVTVTDQMFGRMVEALERGGRLEDTVIIFVSDHAEFFYDVDARDRDRLLETFQDGLRVRSCHPSIVSIPMFVYLPDKWRRALDIDRAGIEANHSRLVSTVDVVPTILDLWGRSELAGQADLDGLDGHSLLEPLPDDRTAFCFNTAAWSLDRGSGFTVLGRDTAIYDRGDLPHAHVYELDDPSVWADRGPGREPTDEELQWVDDLVEREPFLRPYVDHIGARTP
jgi:arylsulfatase A-like enzyme